MTHPVSLIARHIDPAPSADVIQDAPSGAICAFTGQPIARGARLKDVVSDNFTDWEALRYESDWVCEDFVKVVKPCIPGSSRLNSLRSYSFIATETELRILRGDEPLDVVLNPPPAPFVLVCTYGGKKHVAYRARLTTHPQNQINIMTDEGYLGMSPVEAAMVYAPAQEMYSVLPGSKTDETYFTKQEIHTGKIDDAVAYKKMQRFGVDRYQHLHRQLSLLHGGAMLQFITHFMKKYNATPGS